MVDSLFPFQVLSVASNPALSGFCVQFFCALTNQAEARNTAPYLGWGSKILGISMEGYICIYIYIRRPCRCYSKAGRRLGPPKVSSIDLPFHLCSQVQTDHQAVRPPKLSLLRGPRLLRDLRDPGLPRQRFKSPAGLFMGSLRP